MSLNHREIDLILQELDITGTFLQNIYQPDYHHIIFELYGQFGNTSLLVSLHQDSLRFCSTGFKWKRSITLPRFARFLRARIKGAKVVSIEQVGKERIIEIILSKGDNQFHLFVKLWGRSANIILTDSQFIILDSFSRRPRLGESPQDTFDPHKLIRENPPARTVRNYLSSSSFNEFIDKEFRKEEKNKEISTLRERVQRTIEKEIRRTERSYDDLQVKRKEYSKHKTFTLYGDYIKNNLYKLPKEVKEEFLIVNDYEIPGLQIKIPLQPNLSPMENANNYYKKAIKAKRGLTLLEEEIIRKKKRIEKLKIQSLTIDKITAPVELTNLLNKLHSVEKKSNTSSNKGNSIKSPGLTFTSSGYNILIGRTSDENDRLLRKYVRGSDYWLHTRDYPGGYVFIKSQKGNPIPQNVLIDAANLAVFFSKAKKNNEADLYYTQVKYLRRAKGAKKGTVLPTQEKNIFVKTEKDRLSRLLDKPIVSI